MKVGSIPTPKNTHTHTKNNGQGETANNPSHNFFIQFKSYNSSLGYGNLRIRNLQKNHESLVILSIRHFIRSKRSNATKQTIEQSEWIYIEINTQTIRKARRHRKVREICYSFDIILRDNSNSIPVDKQIPILKSPTFSPKYQQFNLVKSQT